MTGLTEVLCWFICETLGKVEGDYKAAGENGRQNNAMLRVAENDILARRIVTRNVSEGLGFVALADASD